MPKKKRKRQKTAKALKPWELAFLTGDESGLRHGTRDAAKLKIVKADIDSFLIYGDRTARQLLEEFPEYRSNLK